MEPSQPMEEESHEIQQHVRRGGKRKWKANVTPNPSVPA